MNIKTSLVSATIKPSNAGDYGAYETNGSYFIKTGNPGIQEHQKQEILVSRIEGSSLVSYLSGILLKKEPIF
jgi:hypothetical protein